MSCPFSIHFNRQVFLSYCVLSSVDRKGVQVSALNRFAVPWGERDMDNSRARWILSGEGMWQPEEGDQPHTLFGINKQHQPPQREAEEGSEGEVRWQKRGREFSKMRQCTGVWRHGSSSGSQAG